MKPHDLLPFVFGFVVTAIQPLTDLAWLPRFKRVFRDDIYDVAAGARWAADTSQFLPSGAITLVGVALLAPTDSHDDMGTWIVAIGLVVIFALYLAAAFKRQPRIEARRQPDKPGAFPKLRYWLTCYTPLQYILLGLNAAGIAYVQFF